MAKLTKQQIALAKEATRLEAGRRKSIRNLAERGTTLRQYPDLMNEPMRSALHEGAKRRLAEALARRTKSRLAKHKIVRRMPKVSTLFGTAVMGIARAVRKASEMGKMELLRRRHAELLRKTRELNRR